MLRSKIRARACVLRTFEMDKGKGGDEILPVFCRTTTFAVTREKREVTATYRTQELGPPSDGRGQWLERGVRDHNKFEACKPGEFVESRDREKGEQSLQPCITASLMRLL